MYKKIKIKKTNNLIFKKRRFKILKQLKNKRFIKLHTRGPLLFSTPLEVIEKRKKVHFFNNI